MKWLPEGWQDVGAVAGMIALAWNGVAAFRNRHRFTFECNVMRVHEMGPNGYQPTIWVAHFEVVNVGVKSGFLSGVYGSTPKTERGHDRFLIRLDDLPKELKPGERWTGHAANLSPLDASTIELWAEDTEKRKSKLSRKRLKFLKAEVAEVRAATPEA